MKKLLFILLLLPGSFTWGQATAQLEQNTIALGDQTTLTIRHARKYPSTDLLSQNGIVALSQSFDTATHTQYTVLTSFEPGEHVIRLSDDDSLTLTVTDVEIDTTSAEIRDIAPIVKIPHTFWEIFRWFLLALAVAALAFGIWWLLSHRKAVKQVLGLSEPVDTRTPQQRAQDNIEALRRKQLWQTGKTKEYYTELTDIVRIFIEECTPIHATEMTSDETIEAVNAQTGKGEMLRDLFATADMVKFAKSEPLPHQHDRALSDAVLFIDSLWEIVRPQEPQAKEAANE